MGKIYFLTFGGPSQNYHDAVKRICQEADRFKIFDEITGRTDEYLKSDELFWKKHGQFIENNKRGYGYWIWKSYLIKKQIDAMNHGDFLVYVDAGCVLNINGKDRLLQYFEIIKNSQHDILTFQMSHKECTWTKMDIFNYLNAFNLFQEGQLMCTVFIVQKSDKSVKVLNKWYDTCCNYNLIDDTPSKMKNHPTFRENRHDQSVWSIINKQHGAIMLDDETYFDDWKNGDKFPFLAKRQI